jgi:hypothetical protein
MPQIPPLMIRRRLLPEMEALGLEMCSAYREEEATKSVLQPNVLSLVRL